MEMKTRIGYFSIAAKIFVSEDNRIVGFICQEFQKYNHNNNNNNNKKQKPFSAFEGSTGDMHTLKGMQDHSFSQGGEHLGGFRSGV